MNWGRGCLLVVAFATCSEASIITLPLNDDLLLTSTEQWTYETNLGFDWSIGRDRFASATPSLFAAGTHLDWLTHSGSPFFFEGAGLPGIDLDAVALLEENLAKEDWLRTNVTGLLLSGLPIAHDETWLGLDGLGTEFDEAPAIDLDSILQLSLLWSSDMQWSEFLNLDEVGMEPSADDRNVSSSLAQNQQCPFYENKWIRAATATLSIFVAIFLGRRAWNIQRRKRYISVLQNAVLHRPRRRSRQSDLRVEPTAEGRDYSYRRRRRRRRSHRQR